MSLGFVAFYVFCFGLINGTLKRRSVVSSLLFLVTLIIIMGGNTLNQDALTYEYIYNIDNSSVEPGFRFLMSIGHLFNLDFEHFKLWVCAIALSLMWIGLERMNSGRSYIIYLFYFIYPFFMDIIQFRNFLSLSLLIFGVSFLNNKKWTNELVFIIVLFFSSTIQIIGIIYTLAILLYRFDSNDKIKKIVILTMLSLTIFSILPSVQTALSQIVSSYGSGIFAKAGDYSEKVVHFGYFAYWIADLLLLASFIYCKQKFTDIKNDKLNNLIRAIYAIATVATLFFPFYTIDLSFHRVFRNVIPLLITGEFLLLKSNKKYNEHFVMKASLLLITIIAIGILYRYDTVSLFGPNYHPLSFNWIVGYN